MAKKFKALFVHGIGDHHTRTDWQDSWTEALESNLRPFDLQVETRFVMLDDLFAKYPIKWGPAIWGLTASLLRYSLFGPTTRSSRGVSDSLSHSLQWHAGMVAQFVSNEQLRSELRDLLKAELMAFQPRFLLGHSLGSLVCYDTLAREKTTPWRDKETALSFVSFGSQIGHPALAETFGGFIRMPEVARWHHLFHSQDRVFTSELKVPSERFQQHVINFPPSVSDWLGHEAAGYLGSPDALPAFQEVLPARSRSMHTQPRRPRRPTHRALIVGINRYADPTAQLSGCVNDAYRASQHLQSWGFPVDEIRMVLDERATAQAIRERLEWLLEGAGPGDYRFLHYSGHGAQIPSYGSDEVVDRLDECLCPHDFGWSEDSSITDNWFHQLYSQLSLETNFVGVLDCCHSGGMARGGQFRVRGLNPPDDIRHRSLHWDTKTQMWSARPTLKEKTKLGSCHPLRPDRKQFLKRRKDFHIEGPYRPLLLQACQESQLAEEYTDGATTYGAYSYALYKQVDDAIRASRGRSYSYSALQRDVRKTLSHLGFTQIPPDPYGPKSVVSKAIPWLP